MFYIYLWLACSGGYISIVTWLGLIHYPGYVQQRPDPIKFCQNKSGHWHSKKHVMRGSLSLAIYVAVIRPLLTPARANHMSASRRRCIKTSVPRKLQSIPVERTRAVGLHCSIFFSCKSTKEKRPSYDHLNLKKLLFTSRWNDVLFYAHNAFNKHSSCYFTTVAKKPDNGIYFTFI